MRRGTVVALALILLGSAVAVGGAVWTPSTVGDCESGYYLDVERTTPPEGAAVRDYGSLPDPAKGAFRAGVADVPIAEREPLTRTYGLDGAVVRYEGETYRVRVLVRDCRYQFPTVLGRIATAGGVLLAVFVATVWGFWRFAFVPATEGSRRPEREAERGPARDRE